MGEEYNVLDFDTQFSQGKDATGKPIGEPKGGTISVIIESTQSTNFLSWMLNSSMTKDGKIVFYRRDAMSKMKELLFVKAFCVNYREQFTSTGRKGHFFGAPEDMPEKEGKSKLIKDAYWCDKYGKKINCLLYSVKTVYVRVNLLKKAKGKKITIVYNEYNAISNTDLNKNTNYTIENDDLQQLCPITFTINDYTIEDEDDVSEYIFEIKIDDEKYFNTIEQLKVHAVIYIP